MNINGNALSEQLKTWNHTVSGPAVLAKMLSVIYPELRWVNKDGVVKITIRRSGKLMYDSSTDARLPTIVFSEFIFQKPELEAIAPVDWLDRYDINRVTRQILDSAQGASEILDPSIFSAVGNQSFLPE